MMVRWKFTPQEEPSVFANRIVLNGIAISADHPSSVIRVLASHFSSQFGLRFRPSSLMLTSRCVPSGLMRKR